MLAPAFSVFPTSELAARTRASTGANDFRNSLTDWRRPAADPSRPPSSLRVESCERGNRSPRPGGEVKTSGPSLARGVPGLQEGSGQRLPVDGVRAIPHPWADHRYRWRHEVREARTAP